MEQRLLEEVQDVAQRIVQGLGLELRSETRASEEGIELCLSGKDETLLLHRNAAVLFALDYILNRMFSGRLKKDEKITTDSRNFRKTRQEELRLMAIKASERAIAYGQSVDLHPMPPHERRIIHLALQDQPKVRTISEGIGDDRKVIIVPA